MSPVPHFTPIVSQAMLSEPIIVAVIAAGGGSVAGLAALIVGLLNHRREKAATATSDLRHLLEEMRKTKAEQDGKIDDLTGKVTRLEKGREEDHRRIRALEDRDRDAQELLAEFVELVLANDDWTDAWAGTLVAAGEIPPPPMKSWRIRQHMQTTTETNDEEGG